MFGFISGLIWSIVPGLISGLFVYSLDETVTVFASGALAGLLVSFALGTLLMRSNFGSTLAFGLLSLPLGAFAFGVFVSLVQWIAREFTGVPYRFVADGFSPFETGFDYAVYSLFSSFAFFLIPLAILTTFILRAVIRSGGGEIINEERRAQSDAPYH
jgi:hypothetical protein